MTNLIAQPWDNWQEMAGQNSYVKKINGLLTNAFFGEDFPDDECVTYGEHLFDYFEENDPSKDDFVTYATDYLHIWFEDFLPFEYLGSTCVHVWHILNDEEYPT